MAKNDPSGRFERLKTRIEVLERRSAALRAEVERLSHGQPPRWTPFQEADSGIFGDGRMIGHGGGSYRVFVNSRYQVAVFHQDAKHANGRVATVHLSIKRIDGCAVHDWRDFQRIKNELAGPEAEGVELYPAESRLVDGANQYHLYCLIGQQWPIGFTERLVAEDSENGVQQRPWQRGERPADIQTTTAAQMAAAAGLE